MAELEQPRTTGPSSYIMTSSTLGTGAGMSSSIASQPPISLSNLSNYVTTMSYGAQATGSTSYSTNASHNLSPLPIRANQISTMPPLCQVQRTFFPLLLRLVFSILIYFDLTLIYPFRLMISLTCISMCFTCFLV